VGDEDNRLVLDADVVTAAGEFGPNLSRETLVAIRRSRQRLVLSAQLEDEWSRNASGYSKTWWTLMEVRGRIDAVGDVRDPALRAQIQGSLRHANAWPAIEKDVHLVEAALGRGLRVISQERKVRKHFRQAAKAVTVLGRILWANPTLPEDVVPWIDASTPREAARQLDPKA
jgi:hypothetical protein